MSMNSFNKIFFLIILSLFLSCSDNRNDKIIEKLQGDWIPNNRDEGYYLSFKGNMVSDSENEFTHYYIKDNTIIIPKGWINSSSKMSFKSVTNKYIWFTDTWDAKTDLYPYISTNTNYNERIILKDIEIKFQNDFYFGLNRWSIYLNDSLDCFLGAFYIRNRGKGCQSVPGEKGIYYSKLTRKEFEFIERKVRNISLSSLKDTYGSFKSDIMHYDPTIIDLQIRYNLKDKDELKVAKLRFIDFTNPPSTLAILINYLHQLHYFVEFKQTNKTYNFNN